MAERHEFTARIDWTGNRGEGTASYRGYDRSWDVTTPGKPVVHCSNDPRLGGDPALPNPEDMLLASLAACHMLWYLHLAGREGIVVTRYRDEPVGVGESEVDGSGRFVEAILRPVITIAPGGDIARAEAIHHEVGRHCFVARSVAFPIRHEPSIAIG